MNFVTTGMSSRARILSLFLIGILFIRLGGLGLAEIASCAGASSSEIGTAVLSGTKAFPQFMQLPAEDCRSILFSTWQDLEQMVDKCKQGKLPCATDCHELVLQLQPIPLANLVNSIELKPPLVSEAAIQEWARISVELKSSAYRLLDLFEQALFPGLIVITGIQIPLSMPLEESLQLLLQLPLPREVQSYYAAQILYQAQPLVDVYRALFELLPSNPDILYLEKDIHFQNVNPGRNIPISQSEAEAIQAVHARFRQTIRIAMRFHRLRHRIRKGIKRQRGV